MGKKEETYRRIFQDTNIQTDSPEFKGLTVEFNRQTLVEAYRAFPAKQRPSPPRSRKKIQVPMIDIGPAKSTGHALDLTVAAAREFEPNATARNFSMRLDFRILKGARFVDPAEIEAKFASELAANAKSSS